MQVTKQCFVTFLNARYPSLAIEQFGGTPRAFLEFIYVITLGQTKSYDINRWKTITDDFYSVFFGKLDFSYVITLSDW